MKRRLVAVSLVLALGLSGCAFSSASPEQTAATQAKQAVTLEVVTSYGGDDGSRGAFEAAVAAYEAATGNKVRDGSATSNEGWKAKVLADFETGSEPDVLFFFTNADADPIINAGRVISIEDIREVYPDYASNMKQSMLAEAADGKHYAVPAAGYWENLFVNKSVLEACGVSVPVFTASGAVQSRRLFSHKGQFSLTSPTSHFTVQVQTSVSCGSSSSRASKSASSTWFRKWTEVSLSSLARSIRM